MSNNVTALSEYVVAPFDPYSGAVVTVVSGVVGVTSPGGGGSTDAADITVTDADGHFDGSTVEEVLAEIGAGGFGGGLAAVVDDTTPQLGGDLDLNGHAITSFGDIVTHDAADFDPAGTGASEAAAAVTAHEAAADPHPGYLTSAEGAAAYDALGAAAAAVSAHEALSDPHPGYLTAAEGAAAFDALGAAAAAQAASEPAGTVATHAADTTSVHGIADTSVLETTTGAQAKVDAHVNDTSDAHDASAISSQDAGGYFTGTDVEAITQEIGASLAATDVVADLLAGVEAPPGRLGRWKAGPGIPATKLAEDLTSGETDVDVVHAGAFPQSGVARVIYCGTEECLDAGTGTTSRTWTRGVNGSTAAAHTTGDAVYLSRMRTVVGLGDSIQQGTTGGTDAYFDRAMRQLAQRFGGQAAQAWPLWRNVDITQSAQEWDLTGTYLPVTQVNAYSLCPYGSVVFSSGTGNSAAWTRPPWVTVACIDFLWVDPGTTGDGFSYRFDSGSWTTNPSAGTGSTGSPKLRRLRITDVPASFTTFEIRAASAAGTGEGFTIPYMPLITYPSLPAEGQTEGLRVLNLGWDGQTLLTALNARSKFDAVVTNGDATVTSATASFAAADAGSTVYVGPADGTGMWTTIATYTSSTSVELAANYTGTSGSSKQITIFKGDGTGDYLRLFDGDAGSLVPDLLILGPWSNDMASFTGGDENPESMRAMLQYIVTRVAPYCDVLLVACYEHDTGVADSLQEDYRDVYAAVAAANAHVAYCSLFDAFAAAGYAGVGTQGPAMTSAGLTLDGVHLSQAGHYIAGDYLARVLGVL